MSKKKFNNSYFPDYDISPFALEASKKQSPLANQLLVILMSIFFTIGLIYCWLTEIPVVVESTGKISSQQQPVPVKAQATFNVDKILAQEGIFVKKNKVLVTSAEQLSGEDVFLVKEYTQGLKQVVFNSSTHKCDHCIQELERLSTIYLKIKAQGEIQSVLMPINDAARDLQGLLKSYDSIEATVSDLRLSIMTSKQKLIEIKKRNAEKMLAREVESLNQTIVGGQTRIQERFQGAQQAIRQSKSMLKARLIELQNKMERLGKVYAIVAPVDGIISNIKLKGSGELLSGGQTLMEIIPSNSKMNLVLDVANKDIGQVHLQDEVIVSVDAFPEIDYGVAKGHVHEILKSDLPENSNAQGMPQNFIVRVNLEQQNLQKGNREGRFLIGMTAKGKVVVRYESILKTAYRTLFRVKEDLGSVRK